MCNYDFGLKKHFFLSIRKILAPNFQTVPRVLRMSMGTGVRCACSIDRSATSIAVRAKVIVWRTSLTKTGRCSGVRTSSNTKTPLSRSWSRRARSEVPSSSLVNPKASLTVRAGTPTFAKQNGHCDLPSSIQRTIHPRWNWRVCWQEVSSKRGFSSLKESMQMRHSEGSARSPLGAAAAWTSSDGLRSSSFSEAACAWLPSGFPALLSASSSASLSGSLSSLLLSPLKELSDASAAPESLSESAAAAWNSAR